MAWTKYQILVVVCLVVTGSFNTLSTSWADRIESEGADGTVRHFTHPYVQAVFMFIGEMSCLLAFNLLFSYYRMKNNSQDDRDLTKGNRNFSVWIFFLPAMCDVIATSTMYVGLTLTYASSFQMLRGSLIIFVALLSVTFLRRKITLTKWIGIFFVIIGLAIVGVSDFFQSKGPNVDSNSVLTGDLLIIAAQIMTAIQVIVEEHFVNGKDIPPLQAVGWEGVFGFSVLGFLLIPMYYIYVGKPISNSPMGRLEDLNDALTQIKNNLLLLVPILGNAVSIAFFNFAGISVTKELSGTTRTVLDSVRTFFVWAACLALGWQRFSGLQVLGFFLLLVGIFVYNDVIIPKYTRKFLQLLNIGTKKRQEAELTNQAPDEVVNS